MLSSAPFQATTDSAKRVKLLCSALCTLLLLGLAAGPAHAGRGIVIDNTSDQIVGDATNGDTVLLASPVNYGSGLQSSVKVSVPSGSGTALPSVGLIFTDSPADSLFATLFSNSGSIPEVLLSNGAVKSTPIAAVSSATNFDFGNTPQMNGGGGCVTQGVKTYCYGTFSGLAGFHFTDLSSFGTAGDFGLTLECSILSSCANIGFNLAGLQFSSLTFDPLHAPTQLVSYDRGPTVAGVAEGTFNFVFRNGSAVPEPGTWLSIILGFGMMGGALRHHRKRTVGAV